MIRAATKTYDSAIIGEDGSIATEVVSPQTGEPKDPGGEVSGAIER